MSIANEIQRISSAKTDLKAAINARGGSLTTELLGEYAAAVTALPSGGGADVTGVTAQPADVASGAYYVNSSGVRVSGTMPTVSAPTPSVVLNPSIGVVTASYTPLAGRVTDTAAKSTTLQLPAYSGGNYTPGLVPFVFSRGAYLLTDIFVSGDQNLSPSNIRSGTSLFGIEGVYRAPRGYADVTGVTASSGGVVSGMKFVDSAGNLCEGIIPVVSHNEPVMTFDSATGYIDVAHRQNYGYLPFSAANTIGSCMTLATLGTSTYTPTTSSQTISAYRWLIGAQTIAGDANLVASNIASGVKIFGVTGTLTGGSGGGVDLSGVTAAAEDVTSGKAFVTSDGVLTSGTMPRVNQPSPTVSVNSATGLVKASYTPLAGRVTYTMTKSGTLQLPVVSGGTITPGSAAVVISGGQYLTGAQTIAGDANLVASNIASGVTIFGVAGTHEGGGGGITPVSNLSNVVATACGSWYKGVLCENYGSGEYPTIQYLSLSGNNDFSISAWMLRNASNANAMIALGNDYGPEGNEVWFELRSDRLNWGNGGADEYYQSAAVMATISADEWHHCYLEYNATTRKFTVILDGVSSATQSDTKYNEFWGDVPFGVNVLPRSTDVSGNGKYARVQVFSRRLSAAEITALAGEFTPTNG